MSRAPSGGVNRQRQQTDEMSGKAESSRRQQGNFSLSFGGFMSGLETCFTAQDRGTWFIATCYRQSAKFWIMHFPLSFGCLFCNRHHDRHIVLPRAADTPVCKGREGTAAAVCPFKYSFSGIQGNPSRYLDQGGAEIALHPVRQDRGHPLFPAEPLRRSGGGPDIGP